MRVLLLMVFVLLLCEMANAAAGVVAYKQSGCDYFVVSTASGYDVLEWFGGYDPDKDDILVGDYETYGFHDIYDNTTDEELKVWVEDYGLSKGDALEKMVDKCE